MKIKNLALTLLCLLTLLSCGGKRKQNLLPNVSGKAGEVLVVIERDQWEGAIGNSVRSILADDCPYLAQREPLFSLSNVPPGSFGNMFKMHRNILIVNIDPQINADAAFAFRNNPWARPQVVAQLNASDEQAALAVLERDAQILAEYFEQAERDRVIANAKLYEESSLQEPVAQVTGGIIHFPSGYKLRKKTDTFVWIADEKQYVNQTVLIYTYPAGARDEFSSERIIAMRNSIMQENVPGMFDGSYMTTSSAFDPVTRSLSYKGHPFMETRGFWEVHGDFMGGPFVSHSFYSQDGQSIIVLEAFVYAPKYDKRQYLRQVESLLYSFEWKKEQK